MHLATLKDILTKEELEKYNLHTESFSGSAISYLSLNDLLRTGILILPLLYPNSITDGSSIIAKTFDFLAERANEKGFRIF